MNNIKFDDLGLKESLLKAIKEITKAKNIYFKLFINSSHLYQKIVI